MKTILSKRSEKKEGGFLTSYFDKFAFHSEAAARGILLKKMFLKICKFHKKTPVLESAGLFKYVWPKDSKLY